MILYNKGLIFKLNKINPRPQATHVYISLCVYDWIPISLQNQSYRLLLLLVLRIDKPNTLLQSNYV